MWKQGLPQSSEACPPLCFAALAPHKVGVCGQRQSSTGREIRSGVSVLFFGSGRRTKTAASFRLQDSLALRRVGETDG